MCALAKQLHCFSLPLQSFEKEPVVKGAWASSTRAALPSSLSNLHFLRNTLTVKGACASSTRAALSLSP